MITHDPQTIRQLGTQGLLFKQGLHPEAPRNIRHWDVSWCQNCSEANELLELLLASGGRYRMRGCAYRVRGDNYVLGLVEIEFAGVWQQLSEDGGTIHVASTGVHIESLGDIVTTTGKLTKLPNTGHPRYELVECSDSTVNPTGFDYSTELFQLASQMGIRV